jgi:hypothetical protein
MNRPSQAALLALLAAACDGPPPLEIGRQALVHGRDDRQEYFESASAAVRDRVAGSVVALVPRKALTPAPDGFAPRADSWQQTDGLCPGERFSEQPAAAFCSGVLVDADLVLTAGHCARLAAPQDFVVVLGYYYQAPGKLVITRDAVIDVAGIPVEALDPGGVGSRLERDFAWLRLARPAPARYQPAPIRRRLTDLPRSTLTFAGTGGGVPLKIDQGATIFDDGAPTFLSFVADTDSARGASGGGAFDADLGLLGILGRGSSDLAMTPAGCWTTARAPDGVPPREEFTFAARALEGLCAAGEPTSLCRADCGEPCAALPWRDGTGCGYLPGAPDHPGAILGAIAAALSVCRFARKRRGFTLAKAGRIEPGAPLHQPVGALARDAQRLGGAGHISVEDSQGGGQGISLVTAIEGDRRGASPLSPQPGREVGRPQHRFPPM